MAEWNYEKNGNLNPHELTAFSSKKVWWLCDKGHEWEARIRDRVGGSRCPYCAGSLPIPGHTDLATIHPRIAREWHPTKNGNLKPCDVTFKSGKKVWWLCSKGHEWQATVASRNKGNGCPYCSGRYAIKGENDLQTVNSRLANEWNYEKNQGITPMDVLPNSEKKVWWKCSKGHEWESTVAHRNNGRGCPECAKERRKKKSVSDDSEKT